jgi:hypothetical protein
MGLEVGKVARAYLRRRQRGGGDPERSMTFSLRLTEGQHAKLRFLAGRFDDSKTAVAQKLLNSAMEDALRIVGSFDAEAGDDSYERMSPDRQNRVIDEYVKKYREEIEQIFYAESDDS